MSTNSAAVRLLVFDWDGTLMDSVAKIVSAIRLSMQDMGLEPRPDRELSNIIGLGLWEAVETLFPARDQAFYERFIDAYRDHFLVHDTTPMPLFDGARETVAALEEAGYWLAVATGKSRKGLERVLDETGLRRHFVTTRCADEAHSKPHPQMLHEILDFTGLEPAQAMMVGDTVYDMAMAQNAGVAGVGVSYGVHDCEQLAQFDVLACLDRISDLPVWLEQYQEALQ